MRTQAGGQGEEGRSVFQAEGDAGQTREREGMRLVWILLKSSAWPEQRCQGGKLEEKAEEAGGRSGRVGEPG